MTCQSKVLNLLTVKSFTMAVTWQVQSTVRTRWSMVKKRQNTHTHHDLGSTSASQGATQAPSTLATVPDVARLATGFMQGAILWTPTMQHLLPQLESFLPSSSPSTHPLQPLHSFLFPSTLFKPYSLIKKWRERKTRKDGHSRSEYGNRTDGSIVASLQKDCSVAGQETLLSAGPGWAAKTDIFTLASDSSLLVANIT